MLNLKNKWDTNNVELIQIESRFSNTALKASHWISIKPGTESDLAFGIAALMIKNDIYDRSFVISNFPEFEKNDKLMFFTGKCYIETQELDTAISFFQRIINGYPKSKYAKKSLKKIKLINSLKSNKKKVVKTKKK